MERAEAAPERSLAHRFAGFLERRSGWFILAIVALTALLAVPMVTMAPDERASDSPGGPVYDLEDLYNANLPPRFHGAFFIVEARNGNILAREPLLELLRNTEALRRADRDGKLAPAELSSQPVLFSGYDVDRGQPVLGVYTLADAVNAMLANDPLLATSLEKATDDQVALAVHQVLIDPRTAGFKDLVYDETKVERESVLGREIVRWSAPAMGVFVAGDNEKLGGGANRIGATSDPVTLLKEGFSRSVQAELRGEEQSYRLWGVAIDAGLEIEEEVGTAVPFIVATFIMVLVVVGISLRSARVVGLTALGLASMIVWLKGLSNLAGLESSTVLDFIVPIAMISLGADFTIHAVNRYREEKRAFPEPGRAFRLGMAGVIAALTLAMVTDAIAFLSNASADIETVVGFGIGAALAILAAFIIMGLAVPVALMRLDVRRRDKGTGTPADPNPSPQIGGKGAGRWSLSDVVVTLARRRLIVLPIATAVTVVAGYYAFQLEATFDVKDFFTSDSDFVVSLDKLEEYVGESGGESAIIYIEGDLTDPSALAAMQGFIIRVADTPSVGKNDLGEAALQARTIFQVLDLVMRSDYMRSQIEEASGVSLTEEGNLNQLLYGGKAYLWPNAAEQLRAIYNYISANGVYLDPSRKIYDPLEVGETLFHDAAGLREDATAIVLGIPGTRNQANVIRSRDALIEEVKLLAASPSISLAGLTGSPYTRQAALDATTDGLQRALVIAVVACLLVAIVAMRSVRYGMVTIIPIGLVVAWLYGFMYAFGFGLNFVTATIAAVSIGIGVDYAIHMTQRFREELARSEDRVEALRRAAQGTGVALLASAATSVFGFTIMAFAPMPMFSSYGILTAVMIFLAAAASLLVLPSLLLLVTPRRSRVD